MAVGIRMNRRIRDLVMSFSVHIFLLQFAVYLLHR